MAGLFSLEGRRALVTGANTGIGQAIAVALAGPAVNVVIWAVLMALGASGSLDLAGEIDQPDAGFLERLAAVNLFLALFNLIPAFPMDGGRVFRALLALGMTRVKATQAAATAGQLVAFLFGFWGLSNGNPILVLIAVFIFMAANAESQDVAMRSVARKLTARDAMITSYETLTPADTLDGAAAALIRTTQHEFPVIDPHGSFHGFLTRNALFAALAHDGPRSRPVSQIMETEIPALPLEAGLEQVLDALHGGAPAVIVTGVQGHLVGYITRENVGELMVLKGR